MYSTRLLGVVARLCVFWCYRIISFVCDTQFIYALIPYAADIKFAAISIVVYSRIVRIDQLIIDVCIALGCV